MKAKKSSSLMKTVVANIAEDLEQYEERDLMYEFWMTLTTGKLPTSYRVVHALAVGSRFLRNVTTDRKSKGKS